MKRQTKFAVIAAAFALPAAPAAAVTITFEDVASGTVISNQYASLGVTFTANAFTGTSGAPTGAWATNTSLQVSSTNAGTYGTPSLVSGNLLHSYAGWLTEDGDPSFLMSFSTPISSISVTFAGIGAFPSDSQLFVYNGATLLATVAATGPGTSVTQQTLTYSAASITRVVVTPGAYDDWVGVDNIVFTPAAAGAVPEPATWAMMIGGFGFVGGAMRRRSVKVALRAA